MIDLAEVPEREIERAAHKRSSASCGPSSTGSGSTLTAMLSIMPPCRQWTTAPGGLQWDELETVIRLAVDSGRAVGLEVTIFNPLLDSDGSIAHTLVSCLARSLGTRESSGQHS